MPCYLAVSIFLCTGLFDSNKINKYKSWKRFRVSLVTVRRIINISKLLVKN